MNSAVRDASAASQAGVQPACTGCGARDWDLAVEQNGYRWWRCRACGFATLHPMPSEAAVDAIAGDAIGRDYVEGYKKKLPSKMRRSARRLRRLAARMKGKRLIDVGSNIGCLVEAGRRHGLEAVGVEINRTLVDFARKTFPACNFIAAPIERVDFAPASFDGIYCSEVIEHVPDNDAFAKTLSRLLAPGGVLYLTTPAAGEYIRRSGKARPRDFGAPDHKLYHSRASLAALLKRHGFARVAFQPSLGGHKVFAYKPR